MKAELEHMREDILRGKDAADEGDLAKLSPEVPILPGSFRKSSEMDALKMMLLSSDYKCR